MIAAAQHRRIEAKHQWIPVIIKPLPTMYDLPSENPEEPGVPDQFHISQPNLLSETFSPPDYPANKIVIGCDLNLYYDIDKVMNYKRPDWFAALGVDKQEIRLSYVIWQEKVVPSIVVELLSPGTEDEDLGLTIGKQNGPPTKWEVYEKKLGVPYYVTFSRYTDKLRAFELIGSQYVEMTLDNDRLWFDKLKLGLGLWNGTWDGHKRIWLRWYDINNKWIPTIGEKAEQANLRAEQADLRAEQERQKAEQEKQRAEQERQRAEQADLRAEQERQRAEQLAEKLKALGIVV